MNISLFGRTIALRILVQQSWFLGKFIVDGFDDSRYRRILIKGQGIRMTVGGERMCMQTHDIRCSLDGLDGAQLI